MVEPQNPRQKVSRTVVGTPAAGAHTLPIDADWRALLAPPQSEGEIGRIGHFRILKKLGVGGMGLVLLAEDINLLRPVALKIMLPEYASSEPAKERFLREARSAARIHHDHVVTIHFVAQERGIPYMAMELLRGASLKEYLKHKAGLTIAQTLRIGQETADGLEAAHTVGLIHRDVKPANIWLEAPRGRVKLLDFGLARETSAENRITHSGAVIGTPAYMSPEQANGKPLDPRTDLFSLGIVLYRLVAGRLPFHGPNVMAVLEALSSQPHLSLAKCNPQAPTGLVELIDQLLAKNPDDRPRTAKEVARRLAELSRPALRPDGKPVPDAIEVPMATSVMDSFSTDVHLFAESPLPAKRDRVAVSHVPKGNNRKWLLVSAFVIAVAAISIKLTSRQEPPGTFSAPSPLTEPEMSQVAPLHKPKESLLPAESSWQAHSKRILGLTFTADGRKIISGGDDKTVRIWDAVTGKETAKLDRPDNVFSIRSSADNSTFYSGDREVAIWKQDAPGTDPIARLSPGSASVKPLALTRDGHILAAGIGTRIYRWNLREQNRALPTLNGNDSLLTIAFSDDGRYLAAGGRGGIVRVWDLLSEPPTPITLGMTSDNLVEAIAWSPDGKFLCASFSERGLWNAPGWISVREMPEGKLKATFVPAKAMARALQFMPDSRSLFVASYGGTLSRWDVSSTPPVLMERFAGKDGPLWSLALSRDARSIASGSETGVIRIRPLDPLSGIGGSSR